MDEAPELSTTAMRLRRNRLVLALGLAPLLLGPLFIRLAVGIQGADVAALPGVAGALLSVVSPFLALYVLLFSPRPVQVPCALRAGAWGLELDGRLFAWRDRIRAGFVIPDRLGTLVRIERRLRGPVHFVVKSPDEGRALLRSLGLDASQVVASFRLRSLAYADFRRYIGYLALLALIFGSPLAGALSESIDVAAGFALVCLFVLAAWAVMMAMPARAVVGADGVLISFFWRRRFIPYAQMLNVVPSYHGVQGVALMLQGRVLRLPTRRRFSSEEQDRETMMLAERIWEGIAGAGAGGLAQDAARLARNDRPVATWIAQLRALGAGADADHRTAPIPAERLWRVVEDSTAAPDARAGAAVALAGSGDPDVHARLSGVAKATAGPRLRVALEAAASAEAEAELAEAMEALEAAHDAPRRRAS